MGSGCQAAAGASGAQPEGEQGQADPQEGAGGRTSAPVLGVAATTLGVCLVASNWLGDEPMVPLLGLLAATFGGMILTSRRP